MMGLAIFFFGAATNTMAGWLYVISGVMLALLAIAAVLPVRSLKQITVRREPIAPVTVGEPLTIEVLVENPSQQLKALLLVQERLPVRLSRGAKTAIEVIPPQGCYRWVYQQPTQRRGVYHWDTVQLRTAAPLGLFWCQRNRICKATAIVYPTVLPLNSCPLVDEMGRDTSVQMLSFRQTHATTEGLTRTLRPYRWGDSIRLVHWRTSARYGELRVRELETYTGGQELVIALDSGAQWDEANFEQAVVAAASLYFYARHRNLQVSFWTAATGRIRTDSAVMAALAGTSSGEGESDRPPDLPLLWLTQNSESLKALPLASRWVLWPHSGNAALSTATEPASPSGQQIQLDQPLQLQLQAPLQ
jgi:uncharacterized protein (DUF58 family)